MNRSLSSHRGRNAEAGNAMVISLLVLFLLTSLGVSYVAVTKGDKQVAGNQLVSSQAFSNAEAGIAEVLNRMSNPNRPYPLEYIGQNPALGYTPGWGVYVITDPGNSGLDPQYNETTADGLNNDPQIDASVDEMSEHYNELGSRQNSGMALSNKLDYPWVKVRYKLNGSNQVILFGDHDNNPTTPPQENLVRGVPKLIVTSAGRRGTGQKIVTVEAVKWPLPPVPGSVYTEGPMSFGGAAFYVDGHDHEYTAPWDTIAGAPPVSGISTTIDPNTIESTLNGPQANNILGTGSSPSVDPAPVNLDLEAMADAWTEEANIVLNGNQANPNTSTWGTTSPMNLKIVRINGDLHVSGTAGGAGVLIIDGDMVLSGQFTWYGVVLVLGDVMVTGGGATKQVVGGLMVQGSMTGSAINGNIKTLYSSKMIAQLNALSRYEVASWIDQ